MYLSMLHIAHLNYGVKFIDVHYPRISITNSYWDVKSLTVFGHQALLHWPHKSSCISSLRIVWTHYRLTSPVTLKQFISITKNPTGFGNVSNNKIPVKSSKSHWRLWSSYYKSPLAFLLLDLKLQQSPCRKLNQKRKWKQTMKFPHCHWESSLKNTADTDTSIYFALVQNILYSYYSNAVRI